MELVDPIETTPEFKAIIKKVERQVRYAMKRDGLDSKHPLGWCFIYWDYKKEILKTKYGIDWKAPDEMNPNILYD